MLSQILQRIHQIHKTYPADGGSVGRIEQLAETAFEFQIAKNEVTQVLEVVPFEEQSDDLKKKLAKNNEAKMVLYNALPKKEYERIFMCKTDKDIWQSLLITNQEESINSGFARFNTIITSLKALDEGFSSKNYVRKFLKALHPKWRAKVTEIEESKDLSSLALNELIGNLKVHEVVMEKDSEIYRGKKEIVKSIALKAKKESSDDETLTSESDDEEYARPKERVTENALDAVIQIISLAIFQNNLVTKIKRPSLEVLSDSKNDVEDNTNDETCLMAQSSNEVTLNSSYYSDNASSLDNDKLKLENAKPKETQIKFVKFDKSANLLKEMLNNQKSSSCKIGLGFDNSKASTSGTKPMSFVGSPAENATGGSTIKVQGSTIPGSVNRTVAEKVAEYLFSLPMSLRLDFVITRKKLIHNRNEESKKPSLKPSLKSGLGYVKTESRLKTPPPRRKISSQPRYNTPQPRRNSREPIHQNLYTMNWNNCQSQGFVHMGNCMLENMLGTG
ncbi:hypothetical protein Tco_0432383 [Tanacetum coccineum]